MIRQGVFNDFMVGTRQRVLVKDPYRKPFADLWDKYFEIRFVLRCSVVISLIWYYAT